MVQYIDGKRIRGWCSNCGAPTFGRKTVLCWACHVAQKHNEDNKLVARENRLASKRNWYYNNKEHATQKHKEWLEANKDKVQQYNQEHVVERRAYVETRRARLQAVDDGVDASVWKLLLELYDYRCAYCFEKCDKLEQDHVVPLSKGGRHSVTNVVPACLPCNRIKSTSLVEVQHPMYKVICSSVGAD